jgi:hypothetical protein
MVHNGKCRVFWVLMGDVIVVIEVTTFVKGLLVEKIIDNVQYGGKCATKRNFDGFKAETTRC